MAIFSFESTSEFAKILFISLNIGIIVVNIDINVAVFVLLFSLFILVA